MSSAVLTAPPKPSWPSPATPAAPPLRLVHAPPTATTQPKLAKAYATSTGPIKQGERVVIYGCGGIGKTSLAALAPRPKFIDTQGGTNHLNVSRVTLIDQWQDVRDALHQPSLWAGVETIVLDTASDLQEWAVAHTLRTVPHEKSEKPIVRIEDYGYGKGYEHVFDTFLPLLSDLDMHAKEGRNIIVVCHETIEKAPNPDGEDYLRYEPALMNTGKFARLRERIKAWCDHLLYIQYDRDVSKDGKAKGRGSRTIYPTETATYWAKSRVLRTPIVYTEGDGDVWRQLLSQP